MMMFDDQNRETWSSHHPPRHVILSEAKDLRDEADGVPATEILSEAKDDMRRVSRS